MHALTVLLLSALSFISAAPDLLQQTEYQLYCDMVCEWYTHIHTCVCNQAIIHADIHVYFILCVTVSQGIQQHRV